MLFYKLFKDKDGRKVGFVQANEACIEAALLAGMRFFAGYPITPSSEMASVSSEKLPMYGGKFIQMEDEIAAMTAVCGASMAGLKAMTATSGPGFSLKQEAIGYAAMNEIPCVIVNVQRAGPSTGLPTQVSQGDVMQARWGTHGDHPIIVLSPSTVVETADLTFDAFNLAEKYRTPVILLMDETLAHMREKITLPAENELKLVERKRATVPPSDYRSFDTRFGDVPPFEPYGGKYHFHITGLTHDEMGFPIVEPDDVVKAMDRIHRKINNNLDDIVKVKQFQTDDAEILLVSFGTPVRTCLGAMEIGRKEGLKIGVLQLQTIWPFPDKAVLNLAKKIGKIFVVELNMGQIINEVQRASQGKSNIKGINKYDGLFISPEEILGHIIESKG